MEESIEENDRREEEGNEEQNTDVYFTYNDVDEYGVEIAELYSYSEEPEFHRNRYCFQEYFKKFAAAKWFEITQSQRQTHIRRLLDRLESGHGEVRHQATRCLLYLLQGNFGECELEEDQVIWAKRNVYLCIDAGLLPLIIQSLLYEIEYDKWNTAFSQTKLGEESVGGRDAKTRSLKSPVTMSASTNLRLIISILYTMVETVRDDSVTYSGTESDSKQQIISGNPKLPNVEQLTRLRLREQFLEELATPLIEDGEITLAIILFGMAYRFCSGLAPHFPMKKVLLLLWKVLLVTMGPVTGLFKRKNAARARFSLPALSEDTHQVVRRMRASSPPESSTDRVLGRTQRANNRVISHSELLPRRGSLAGNRTGPYQLPDQPPDSTGSFPKAAAVLPAYGWSADTSAAGAKPLAPGFDTPRPGSPVLNEEPAGGKSLAPGFDTPRPGSPVLTEEPNGGDMPLPAPVQQPKAKAVNSSEQFFELRDNFSNAKLLPWKPKVGTKEFESFLTSARFKFVDFHVPNDTVTLVGLPQPIQEAVKVMRKHLYISLAECQLQRENLLKRYPMSLGKDEIPHMPMEQLYRATYLLLPHYVIALLKVLLAAVPTSRTRTEPINILGELTPDQPFASALHADIFTFDVNRHRELVVKAISAILLLLLKHMKLNHVYQFEYVSQYLVFANCIPLILKFFNQNVRHYVQAKNTLAFLDFPARLFGDPPELTPDMLLIDANSYCWRNLFSCINLLRVLNMLTKWKPARIILLVVYKSSPILKRVLRVRHPMMQLYVLKLLKQQSRYLGRQWRKNNMSILSVIYQKVRHRLIDDWAYGSDVDSIPVQFQTEECNLRANVDAFNRRRYSGVPVETELQPVDNCLKSCLNQAIELSDEFKQNYEKWLEEEVFSVPINWAQVLAR